MEAKLQQSTTAGGGAMISTSDVTFLTTVKRLSKRVGWVTLQIGIFILIAIPSNAQSQEKPKPCDEHSTLIQENQRAQNDYRSSQTKDKLASAQAAHAALQACLGHPAAFVDPFESDRRKCESLKKAVTDARKELGKTCSSLKAGIADEFGTTTSLAESVCIQKATECLDMNTREAELDLTTQLLTSFTGFAMPTDTFQAQCTGATKEKKRELRDDKKTVTTKIEDLEKELIELQEQAQKDQKEIQDALKDLNKRSRQEDLEMKAEERSQEAERFQAQADSQRQAQEIQMAIMRAQAEMNKIIGERAGLLARLSNAAIQFDCEVQTQEILSKLTAASSGGSGSTIRALRTTTPSVRGQNALHQRAQNRKAREQHHFAQCVKGMQLARENTRKQTDGQLRGVEAQIENLEQQLASLQQQTSLFSQLDAQAKADQEQNKTQIQQERIAEVQSLYTEMQNLTSTNQAKVQKAQQDLAKKKMELSKLSNELASVDGVHEGKTSFEEASAQIGELELAIGELEKFGEANKALCPIEEGSIKRSKPGAQ